MELSTSQNKAVEELLTKFQDKKDKVVFKSPTGSGKTFVITNFINRVIEEHANSENKFIFIYTTLSSAHLPQQTEKKFKEYKKYLKPSLIQEVRHFVSPSTNEKKTRDKCYDIAVKPNMVYIFGAASFGKNRIFTEQGVFKSFIDDAKHHQYTIIYIRDEANIGGDTRKRNAEEERNEAYIQDKADFVIKMSATPHIDETVIEITEKDLLDDKIRLLKTNSFYNDLIGNIKGDLNNEQLLNIACTKFKEVKEAYAKDEHLRNVNPALLIQVRSKTENDQHFAKEMRALIEVIKANNLQYQCHFEDNELNKMEITNSRRKLTLDQISDKSSDIDVVIFKIGPATGWEIPRACMLVQLRDVSSDSLNVQTIGRIKRNSIPEVESLKDNHLAYNYYIYSNLQEDKRAIRTFYLDKKFHGFKFPCGVIENHNTQNGSLQNDQYWNNIKEYLDKKIDHINKRINDCKEQLWDQNGKYQGICKKVVYTTNEGERKDLLVPYIDNYIRLDIEINKLKKATKHFLKKDFLERIKKTYASKQTLLWLYIFYKECINEIKEIYNEHIKSMHKEENINYVIKWEYKELPKEYKKFFNSKEEERDYIYLANADEFSDDFKLKSYYLDEKKYQSKKYELTFQSKNESNFIHEIFKEIKHHYKKSNLKNIYFLANNPQPNGVTFEYFDKYNQVAQSYPDFIFINEYEKDNKNILNKFLLRLKAVVNKILMKKKPSILLKVIKIISMLFTKSITTILMIIKVLPC